MSIDSQSIKFVIFYHENSRMHSIPFLRTIHFLDSLPKNDLCLLLSDYNLITYITDVGKEEFHTRSNSDSKAQ